MHITMNIFIKETEARELWERCAQQEGEPSIGQDLANWVEGFCSAAVENEFMYESHIEPRLDAQCHSNTETLLKELLALDTFIHAHLDGATPAVTSAKERRGEIKGELVDEEEPGRAEAQLQELLNAYADLIG